MTPGEIATRIFRRAERFGFDRETVARHSGLEAARVEAIEQGERMTVREFERICLALAVEPSAVYSGQDGDPRRSPTRFRTAADSQGLDARDVRLLALAAVQGRALAELLRLLGREVRITAHRSVIAPATRRGWSEGYRLGEAAREALTEDSGSPLANVEHTLNALGVHVARVDFSVESVDAASVWEPGAVPVVLLNTRSGRMSHPGAERAALAHELCHLLHDGGEHDLTTQVSAGRAGSGNFADRVEVRARAFAPAFLAPRAAVRAWAKSSANRRSEGLVRNLGEHWGLSFEGAAWHAKNCGVISAEEGARLANLSRKPRVALDGFERQAVPTPLRMISEGLPEAPSSLWDGLATMIVLEAFEAAHISEGRAAELVSST